MLKYIWKGGEIMPNIFDYLIWRSDLTFDNAEPNEIDALIFSELSYVPFENIVPELGTNRSISLAEASERFFEINGEKFSLGLILPSDILVLLKKAAQSKRFSNVSLWGYKSDTCLDAEKQFSAICFSYGKLTYVTYRGTDDTIIGWKEDLNMSLFTPVPSQKEGAEYLEKIAKLTQNKLIVTGHSKGGNIAVYSALNCPEKYHKRIEQVYSFDGPGFMNEYISHYKDIDITEKITTILPSKSVVGRIFEIIGNYKIIKSSTKGLMQHDAFTWHILGTRFLELPCFEKPSDNFHELLKAWVYKMPISQRHEFVDAFYKLAISSDAATLTDINSQKLRFIKALLKTESSNKKAMFDAIFSLIKEKNAIASFKKAQLKMQKKALKSAKKEETKKLK